MEEHAQVLGVNVEPKWNEILAQANEEPVSFEVLVKITTDKYFLLQIFGCL